MKASTSPKLANSVRLPRYVLGGIFLILVLAVALVYIRMHEREPAATVAPPEPTPVATAAPPLATQDPVLELFNPSEAEWTGQRNATEFKSQLENIVTTAFILRRCNFLNPETYNETYQAMAIYVRHASPNADSTSTNAHIQAAVEAATPSYQLLYARLTCDSPQLVTTADQLAQWRASLLSSPTR